jgi:hypothetical protein
VHASQGSFWRAWVLRVFCLRGYGKADNAGTEYEIGWALDQAGRNRGVPQLRVYRNCSEPMPPLKPKDEREAFGWHSGKSSLVRAGVLPLLTQPGTIEGVGLWRWSTTRPGASGSGGDCFDALAAALLEPPALPGLANPESLDAVRELASELREHSDSVALRVRDALDHAAREWKIQCCHSLEERERQLRSSGRSDEAVIARRQRERLELPKARVQLRRARSGPDLAL